jgi:hypothetical protein
LLSLTAESFIFSLLYKNVKIKIHRTTVLPVVRVIRSKRLRWAGHVAHMGERRGAHRVVVGKPEGRGPLGSPRHGLGNMDCVDVVQDRDRQWALVNVVMNLQAS